MTNGHVADKNQKMMVGGTTIGTTSVSVIGGKLDFAFIPFANQNSWVPTSRFLSSSGEVIYREANTSELVEGASTIKYGTTTGKSSGAIISIKTSLALTYPDGQKTISDIFSYTNKNAKGDSGGPVGRQATKQVFRLLGIHFAGNGSTGYGIKLANIKASYPMTIKTGN